MGGVRGIIVFGGAGGGGRIPLPISLLDPRISILEDFITIVFRYSLPWTVRLVPDLVLEVIQSLLNSDLSLKKKRTNCFENFVGYTVITISVLKIT